MTTTSIAWSEALANAVRDIVAPSALEVDRAASFPRVLCAPPGAVRVSEKQPQRV